MQFFDLCVVGAGPAGIIVALEYARKQPGKTVALVEYGSPDQEGPNSLDESIEIDNPVNHHEPKDATVKGLGGTSATWGGRCVTYDRVDFMDRPALGGNCTWDESMMKQYAPYMRKSAEYFQCGSPVFSTADLDRFKDDRIAEGFVNGPVTDTAVERYSMPTRFGVHYADELRDRANITLFEGFEARRIHPGQGGAVESMTFRSVGGREDMTLRAARFVIAAGAQESTRLLLRNTDIFAGMGGAPRALGHYYQCHLSGKIASVKFSGDPKKTDYGFMRGEDGAYIRRRFQFTADFLVENNLLNTAMWLDNPLYYDASHRSGDLSFMYLAMITPGLGTKLAPPAIARSITKGVVRDVPQHIGNVVRGLPGSIFTPASVFYRRYLRKRKLPGIFLYNSQNTYALHFHSEQVPLLENRMHLGADGETLHIKYKYSEKDVSSVIRLHEKLDEWLRACKCGELLFWHPKDQLDRVIREISMDGLHQVGTTRIAASADEGVVDRGLKVFGTSNLYVCSSSVFPTSGQANPTYLLGTFAARLADNL